MLAFESAQALAASLLLDKANLGFGARGWLKGWRPFRVYQSEDDQVCVTQLVD